MTDKTEILIDCYGKHHFDQEVTLNSGEKCFFLFDNKSRRHFSMALFLNQAAMSRDVFRYPRSKRVCFLSESPSNVVYNHIEQLEKHFPLIFTHNERLLKKGTPYRRLLLGNSWIKVPDEDLSSLKTQLVSFIGSIQHGDDFGYSLRKQVVQSCLSHDHVDCYGKGIKEIESKLTGLKHYAFSIAMENVQENHYFSEKLIDCFLAETVPIYWGSPGIGEHFDTRGMIVFQTLKELLMILDQLNMEQYREMLPYVKINKQIVIDRRWHSLSSLYERLAEEMLEQSDISLTGLVQPNSSFVSILRRIKEA